MPCSGGRNAGGTNGALVLRHMRYAVFLVCMLLLAPSQGRCEFLVYAGDLPPYHCAGEDGRMHGFSISVLERVMERSGVPFDAAAVRTVPWARSMKETAEKPGRVVVGVARTPEREADYLWVGPVFTLKMGLVAKKTNRVRVRDRAAIHRLRIGVIHGSAPESVLRSEYAVPGDALTPVIENEHQLRILEANRVDCITHVDTVVPSLMRQFGIDPDAYEMIYVLKELPMYFVFSKATEAALIRRIQENLEALRKPGKDGVSEYDRLLSECGRIRPLDMAGD